MTDSMILFPKIRLAYLDELEKDYVPPSSAKMFTNDQYVEGAQFMANLFGHEVDVVYWLEGDEAEPNIDKGVLLNPKFIAADPGKWLHDGGEITSAPENDMVILRKGDGFDTRWIMDISTMYNEEVTGISVDGKTIAQGSREQVEAWLANV